MTVHVPIFVTLDLFWFSCSARAPTQLIHLAYNVFVISSCSCFAWSEGWQTSSSEVHFGGDWESHYRSWTWLQQTRSLCCPPYSRRLACPQCLWWRAEPTFEQKLRNAPFAEHERFFVLLKRRFLLTAFDVLAGHALAQLRARDVRLETLAVLLQSPRLFASSAFWVPWDHWVCNRPVRSSLQA